MKTLLHYVSRILPRFGRIAYSLSWKLTLGFALVLVIFTAVSGFTVLRLDELERKDEELRALGERQQTALELKEIVQEMDASAAGYLLSGKPELAERFMASVEPFYARAEAVGSSAGTRDQRNWRARLTMVSKEFVGNFERAVDQLDDPALDDERRRSLSAASYNASQLHKQTMFELVESFYDDYTAAEASARSEYSALIAGTSAVAVWANVLAVVLAVFLASVVVRSLTGGVRQLRRGIERVRGGDLSQRIASTAKDELGTLSEGFDESVGAVRAMLSRSKGIAERLQEHSRHFSAFASSTKDTNASIVRAMEEIAAGTSRQAEQSDASVRTIEELAARMDAILASAELLLETSFGAKRSAQHGSAAVRALNDSSERTGNALRTMSDALHRLEGRSAEIGKMTNAIHQISQQTNILALNASIEAARAGEHGKGFSVIAEEVRLLSLQATEASREIDRILRLLRTGVQESASTLASTADSFSEQQLKVSEAGDVFLSLVGLIDAFDEEIRRIGERVNDAKRKQAELVDAVHIVSTVAQQAAAGVEETVAAATTQDEAIGQIAVESQEINVLAESLFGEIDKFKM
ncbi:methyl-accepting chemotaxis protein [Paenibacillus sp.]|uniref:methyl-accepting chemotaxis protein n=1 Tax=Paenibacillus sp. TaxID=58172 RepID=UPI002D3C71A8|nr:methyl-accepting chemotaxis protein [Paenibacillus sp.]HZG57713.1 methyl-accepting chemotaxis protein [Paenibacillus sp.]